MLFLYDTDTRELLTEEIKQAVRLRIVLMGLSPQHFRHAVRVLTRHDKVVVPTQVDLCTPIVERMRAIAAHCGIEVINLTAYLKQRDHSANRPVAAAAVPPAQQHAAAGQNH